MKLNKTVVFLSINKTWSHFNDPCTLYKCIGKYAGESQIETVRMQCEASCTGDYIYKTLPNECCGRCIPMFCKVNEKKFKAGEIWKSSDNCTVNECLDTGTDLIVTSYKKSCPKLKNCPQENLEIRDCCSYCNYRTQSKLLKINQLLVVKVTKIYS